MKNPKNPSHKPSGWAKTFGKAEQSYIEFSYEGVYFENNSEQRIIPIDKIEAIECFKGLVWGSLRIEFGEGSVQFFRGLPKGKLKKYKAEILQRKDLFIGAQTILKENPTALDGLSEWILKASNGELWVANVMLNRAKQTVQSLSGIPFVSPKSLTDDTDLQVKLEAIYQFNKNVSGFRTLANEKFIPKELDRFKELFDTVESNPLTESQRLAVLCNEDNTRVIAGAGSGKTSVVIAKAGYLIKSGLCTPEQILLVAFNRTAADEIQERIKVRLGYDVNASTFHSLGMSIIGEVTGKKPLLAKIAEDRVALLKEVKRILTDLMGQRGPAKAIRKYFQSFLYPEDDSFKHEKKGDRFRRLKEVEPRALDGTLVKSFGEVEIANFLLLNGVKFEYEKPYEIETADAESRQYCPDFFLSDYEIYLEHFGIARDGSTAAYINRQAYREGMEWKRKLHKENGTTLLETYSYMTFEKNLEQELYKILKDVNVEMNPLSGRELAELIINSEVFNPFIQLVSVFLSHFKGNDLRVESLKKSCPDARTKAFLDVFDPFFIAYQAKLAEDKTIDFNDMIIRASDLCANGSYKSPYTHVIVDEFQDISSGRARLVKALVSQKDHYKTFCVGDDWQSIYRFAGSDIAIMRDFEEHFGFTETRTLEHTFRFNNMIEQVATRFVMTNPSQIKKTISTIKKADASRVIVHRPSTKSGNMIQTALQEILRMSVGKSSNVMILGRYNHLQDGLAWSEMKTQFQTLSINFQTVHSSKGMEADYVILVGLSSGRFGFPSEIADDPILNLVLSKAEEYDHAEERRLFYVALTRAKEAVHLIADYSEPSPFVSEILKYRGLVGGRDVAVVGPIFCPECETGSMILRSGQFGNFYSCSNYPFCEFTSNPCKTCGAGILLRDSNMYTCTNANCSHREHVCPGCKTGRLVEKAGKYGVFLGCTNYAKSNCKYTEKL